MNLPGVEDGGNNNSALENKQNFHLGDLQSSTISQQIDGFSNAFFDLLVQGVMAINAFPTADLTFYTMAYPQLRQPLNETRSDVLQYLNSLLIVADSSPSFYLSPLEGLEDLMDRFDPQIMDVFDGLLEKAVGVDFHCYISDMVKFNDYFNLNLYISYISILKL
jgi:hypothetical protein